MKTKIRQTPNEHLCLLKENVQLLKKAKRDCECDGSGPHFHVLLHHDSESGDEYFESNDAQHRRFVQKLDSEVEAASEKAAVR